MGKISNFSTGKGITISQSLSKGFPIVSGGIDVMGYYSKYNRMENTITIARAAKCGYVSFISEKFYLNDKCFSLDLKENINSYFLFNLLKKNEKRIMELYSNSSIPTITSTSLKARWYFSNKLRWTKSNRYIICFYKLPHRPSSAWVKNSQKLQKITFPEYDCWQKFDNFINYINKNDKRLRTGKVGEFSKAFT
ncbi:restriction endonuclease subunit S [Mycoplasmopsis cynos]|uniref:restriction endonuclease subunit S n=1 Tax=Mycoplasmopsis cynos TaxID=171284 RepID=UPI002206D8C4|nr:restriction endonuclease subunit S [Mycoplasmopsis cynos]UWV82570.1 restriction endonuclease subunit S [Mycoplasmopsis cynos]